MPRLSRTAAWLLCAVFNAAVNAAVPAVAAAASAPSAQAPEPSRFGPHESSYVVWQQMLNSGWTDRDDGAARVRYSFKYTLLGQRQDREALRTDRRTSADPSLMNINTMLPKRITQALEAAGKQELFLAYSGEFDFYAGTRPSGPVINRISNPGLHWRLPLKLWLPKFAQDSDNLLLSWEHLSDGQVTEVSTPREIEAVQRAYALGDRAYFDAISRGMDFLGVVAEGTRVVGPGALEVRLKLRHYLNHDTEITWGPLAGRRNIRHYQRLHLETDYDTTGLGRFMFEWRLGDGGLATDSMTLGWQMATDNFPLYVRMHLGPMNTLSNYSQKQNSVGVGLRLSGF